MRPPPAAGTLAAINAPLLARYADGGKVTKTLLAAAVAAGLAVVCGCGQPATTSAQSAPTGGQSASTSASTASATTAARLPGLSADCLTYTPACYTPRVFETAYGVQPLLDRGIDGRGVTVVLPEVAETTARPPAITDIRQDVADFDARFGLARARIQVITTLAGSSASPWLAGLEEVGDTELVHAVAPGATIRELLIDPADVSSPAKFAATWAAAVRIAARNGEVISQSGFGVHFFGEHFFTRAEVAGVNSALEYAAARHVTVVVGSGDYGALGIGSTTPPVKEVSLAADDPLVLGGGRYQPDCQPSHRGIRQRERLEHPARTERWQFVCLGWRVQPSVRQTRLPGWRAGHRRHAGRA